MFWGCFTYNRKGPCHIWKPETKKKKQQADQVIAELNKELEPAIKEQWELETGVQRLSLQGKPSPPPKWR